MPSRGSRSALYFVDDRGGAFAAMAAAIAGAHGRKAHALTSAAVANVPAEIDVVLAEIGAAPRGALPVDVGGADRIDVSEWGHALFEGEGELERLALARIARDRIERRVEALLRPAPEARPSRPQA